MGTYNYIVIPKIKVNIVTKISEDDLEFSLDSYKRLLYDELNFVNDKPLSELSLFDISNLVNNNNVLQNLGCNYYEILILVYLKLREIYYVIISEYDDEKMEKYKDYIIL